MVTLLTSLVICSKKQFHWKGKCKNNEKTPSLLILWNIDASCGHWNNNIFLLVICMQDWWVELDAYFCGLLNVIDFIFCMQIVPCAVLALLIHPSTSHHFVNRVFWAFCVYLEAVSVLPQLRVMQNTKVQYFITKWIYLPYKTTYLVRC